MTHEPVTRAERAALFASFADVAHVGLAVSGGIDSLALMHLARRWRDERAEQNQNAPRLSVLTVDHGLRDGSADETQGVHKSASSLGLACHILRWNPGKKTSRIQADARQARYDLMAACARENGIDAIATAHHLDDQAETLFMRLARGSGVDGLAGIHAVGSWGGLVLLRPLLDVPRSRLNATCWDEGERWFDDPSNEDTRFERVRVRKAMTELERLGIGAAAVARSARRLRRASEALEHAAGEFLAAHARLDETGYCHLDRRAFANAPREIALRALSRTVQGVGGRLDAPRLSRLEACLEGLLAGEAGAATLGKCVIAPRDDVILVVRETGTRGPSPLRLEPGRTCLWDGRYHVSLGAASETPVEVRPLGREGYGELRARLGRRVAMPRRAAPAIVSFWCGDRLLAVPPLGYADAAPGARECAAEFANTSLFRAIR